MVQKGSIRKVLVGQPGSTMTLSKQQKETANGVVHTILLTTYACKGPAVNAVGPLSFLRPVVDVAPHPPCF